jgi:hypothetical protein
MIVLTPPPASRKVCSMLPNNHPSRMAEKTYRIIAALLTTAETYDDIGKRYGVTRQRVGEVASKLKRVGVRLNKER